MNFIIIFLQKTKYHWQRLSIEHRGSVAITIPIAFLLGAVVGNALIYQRMVAAQVYVNRANQALVKSQGSLIGLLSAEAGVQGYYMLNSQAMYYGVVISILGAAITIQILQKLAIELNERNVHLRESRNLIEAIVENVADGVMVVNVRDQIEMFNDAAVKMFGYNAIEVLGWPWQKLLAQTAAPIGKLAAAPEGEAWPISKIWQTMGQRKQGDCFSIEVSINPIALDNHRIIIIRDVTERQQSATKIEAKAVELAKLNASLKISNQSLLQSNRELDQFAYITSHDLKAPLRAIASLSEWIEEDLGGAISEENRSHMNLLRRRVYRMQSLLDSLLEYSRAGRKQTPVTIVNVANLLTDVIRALAPPYTFTINILAPMPTMNTRKQPLQQVFTHFIDNAIRHHPTKLGIVNISVVDQDDRYEFTIADNGNGIEIQFQEKIYTIFQTLNPRDLEENIGAGLATIQKIVTAEGGAVHLESSLGSGAIFRFTWLKQPLIKNDITTLDLR